MKKVRLLLWLPEPLRQQFKDKCKSEGITMARKFFEMVQSYVNEGEGKE